jgi:hypothetical protein
MSSGQKHTDFPVQNRRTSDSKGRKSDFCSILRLYALQSGARKSRQLDDWVPSRPNVNYQGQLDRSTPTFPSKLAVLVTQKVEKVTFARFYAYVRHRAGLIRVANLMTGYHRLVQA